jgi:hypothetical protein
LQWRRGVETVRSLRTTRQFKSHRLRPVFMGAEVPLSMAFDLTR